ncbi:MAG: class I SAM-dependent methyltransferase [Acidobacteria bacterium]|nr:class I SAM-dependent methyltransferase [Acidobacteriota bacterium]
MLSFVVLLALAGGMAHAQGKHPKSGRRIADVMGAAGADWLERNEREIEENPTRAIELLKFEKGMVVADVGAGSGYYATRIAEKVGPSGKVFANDIQPEMLAILKRQLRRKKVANVEPVLGTEQDPKLPENSCDVILMVDVYHEFSHPQEMLQKLKAALKENGRLILLEYRKEDPYVPIRPEHKMSVKEAKIEVEAEGFVLDTVMEDLPWQHILIFKKRG